MKNTLQKLILPALIVVGFSSCEKIIEKVISQGKKAPKEGEFYEYIMHWGEHYANFHTYQQVQYEQLRFIVKFDNTAQYQLANAINQEDINKLYGFSDNNADHHQFSARFGWNWARGSLRLYAYVYNRGEKSWQEIAAIQPGLEYTCSIKVSGDKYIFSTGDTTIEMSRASLGAKAIGYKLYPYFGGDETAPHDIHVWVKELP